MSASKAIAVRKKQKLNKETIGEIWKLLEGGARRVRGALKFLRETYDSIPNKREIIGFLVGVGLIVFSPAIGAWIAPWGLQSTVAMLVKFAGFGIALWQLVSAFVLDSFKPFFAAANG